MDTSITDSVVMRDGRSFRTRKLEHDHALRVALLDTKIQQLKAEASNMDCNAAVAMFDATYITPIKAEVELILVCKDRGLEIEDILPDIAHE